MNNFELGEPEIVKLVTNFLLNKKKWNWHKEKLNISQLHWHWPDIKLIWWKRNSECFIIECKWKSKAKSANSINKEWWLNALWQLITRMNKERIIQKWKTKWDINRADKYWLWLYRQSAQIALYRIPQKIAKTLNLYIFSCNEKWEVIQFSQKDFWKKYEDIKFFKN